MIFTFSGCLLTEKLDYTCVCRKTTGFKLLFFSFFTYFMQHKILDFRLAEVSDIFKISQRHMTNTKPVHDCTSWCLRCISPPLGSRDLLHIIIFPRGVQQTGFNQGSDHKVRVTVSSRTSVLKVPTAHPTDMARDANTRSTISCACREVMEIGGRGLTSEATHVVSTIVWIVDSEVLRVALVQPSDCLFNVPVISQRTHFIYASVFCVLTLLLQSE